MKSFKNTSGFTLLELLAVVVTVVTFASVLITSNQNAVTQANSTVFAHQQAQLKEAIDMWIVSVGTTAAKEQWAAASAPTDILERAQQMLSPATRGTFMVRNGKIVSDAGANMGAHFEVDWPNMTNELSSPNVALVVPTPTPSGTPNSTPGLTPTPSPTGSPTPTPTVTPVPTVSPTPTPTATPNGTPTPSTPVPTPTPSPSPVTVSPAQNEASLELIVDPSGILANQTSKLYVLVANPIGTSLDMTVNIKYPSGVSKLLPQGNSEVTLSVNRSDIVWRTRVEPGKTKELQLTLGPERPFSPGAYVFTATLSAGLPDSSTEVQLNDVDAATLTVLAQATPTPTPSFELRDPDTGSALSPNPTTANSTINLAVIPYKAPNPVLSNSIVYFNVRFAKDVNFFGLSEPSGVTYVGETINNNVKTLLFSIPDVTTRITNRPVLTLQSSVVGGYAITGGIGLTPEATNYTRSLGTAAWVAASPTPVPVPQPFIGRVGIKATPPEITESGVTGAMLVEFFNSANNFDVAYRVVVEPTNATMETTTFTGVAPAYGIVNVSSSLSFVSTGPNPSFVVKIYRSGFDTPDITYNIAW